MDFATRQAAEADLARIASQFGPEQLRKGADRLAALLDQDGTFTDADRARRRGLTIGRQGPDGMSQISGLLNPEARATLDAVLAKLAAPGMCNPDDQTPRVDGQPSEAAIQHDMRSPAQRNHDALNAGCGKWHSYLGGVLRRLLLRPRRGYCGRRQRLVSPCTIRNPPERVVPMDAHQALLRLSGRVLRSAQPSIRTFPGLMSEHTGGAKCLKFRRHTATRLLG